MMAYLAWKGAKPSSFFSDSVNTIYEMELSAADIDTYYNLKDELQRKYAPEAAAAAAEMESTGESQVVEQWTPKLPAEDRRALQQALMRRLVSCIGKLDQVQRDKPGNWKLWQSKLVSEHFWTSLVESERIVNQEIESCVAEAGELEPPWKEQIFGQGVQIYRQQKQFEFQKKAEVEHKENEKKAEKKAKVDEKKNIVKDVRRKEVELRVEAEKKVRELKAAEQAMEKLLREEELSAAKNKGKPKSAAAKPKATKKK